MDALTKRIHALGGELILRNGVFKTIDAWVPIAQLSTLARDATVLNASPSIKPDTNFRGVADNQADLGENADSARTTFGLDGSGIKVGVISDSVSQFEGGLADSEATGDLPKGIDVLDDTGFSSTDEGRAMLELIHDIAPGASLAFASAGNSQSEMAHNILSLVRDGCNVIVDDVSFASEPFFQEGIISQAITEATENHNVVYLSSAANEGRNGFQTEAHWVKDINGRQLLDFDPSENVDTRNQVTITGDGLLTLGWNEPYNGVVGAAKVDLDISLISPVTGQIVFQGNDLNLVTTNPIELVGVSAGTYDIEVAVNDKVPGATLPSVVKINIQQSADFTRIEHPGVTTAVQGHNAGQNTISVAAVPFYLAPPYNDTQTITSEPYSSFGPVTYFFKSNGQRRDKPLHINKPDVSGIDGVNTSFFGRDTAQDKDKLPNFFGTSAAAPNVAAVVALMLEFNPEATPTQIKDALVESAKENPVNGQQAGDFNPQSGFGLIDALAAVHALEPSSIVPDIGRVVPDTVSRGIDQVTIHYSTKVTGLSLDDFTLTRSKNPDNLLLESDKVKLVTDDNRTFVLKGLSDLTSRRGTYFLKLSPNGVKDKIGNGALGGQISFFVTGKPTSFVAIPISDTEIDLSWKDNSPNETGFIIYRATDESFEHGLRTFRVKEKVTTFKDTNGLESRTQYFYKVAAIVNDGAPNPTSDIRAAVTLAPNEVVVDNRSTNGVKIVGGWSLITEASDSFGGDYLTATPSATKSVTFTPSLPVGGRYYVYVRAIKSTKNATNTPVDLVEDGDVKKTIVVNQQKASGWVLLGQFDFDKGTHSGVRIRNTGANGKVVADAVRYQRISTAASGIKVAATAAKSTSLFSTAAVKNADDEVLV
jgi:hypothetical protein